MTTTERATLIAVFSDRGQADRAIDELQAGHCLVLVNARGYLEQALSTLHQKGAYDISARLRTVQPTVPSGTPEPSVPAGTNAANVPSETPSPGAPPVTSPAYVPPEPSRAGQGTSGSTSVWREEQ